MTSGQLLLCFGVGLVVSLTFFLVTGWLDERHYRRVLAEHKAERERERQRWT